MKKPTAGVAAVLALFGVFSAAYWQYMLFVSDDGELGWATISFFFGALATLCMAACFLLAARPRAVEGAFGGLDRMYGVHAYLGVAAVLFVIVHFMSLPGNLEGDEDEEHDEAVAEAAFVPGGEAPEDDEEEEDDEPFEDVIVPAGIAAAVGFLVLVALTLNRRFPYHRWYSTHRLMGLFYVVAVVHVGLVLIEGEVMGTFSLPALLLFAFMLAGLVAYAYKELFYQGRRHRFVVDAVHRLERATEIVLKPVGKMFDYRPGQFAFVTMDAPGFDESHPFTISSAPGEDRLRFTLKVAGDYTRRVRDGLEVGVSAGVDGPHGRFDTHGGADRQVWIAGGIGVTPFLSSLRAFEPGHGKTIRFYYCVREAKEAVFLEEMREKARAIGDVELACLESNDGQRMDLDRLKSDLEGELADWSYYLCGPAQMVAALEQGLLREGVPGGQLHHEEFQIR